MVSNWVEAPDLEMWAYGPRWEDRCGVNEDGRRMGIVALPVRD
jgi:hypothetical protein